MSRNIDELLEIFIRRIYDLVAKRRAEGLWVVYKSSTGEIKMVQSYSDAIKEPIRRGDDDVYFIVYIPSADEDSYESFMRMLKLYVTQK